MFIARNISQIELYYAFLLPSLQGESFGCMRKFNDSTIRRFAICLRTSRPGDLGRLILRELRGNHMK